MREGEDVDELLRGAIQSVLRHVSATTDVVLTVEDGEWPDGHGPFLRITSSDGATETSLELSASPADRSVLGL